MPSEEISVVRREEKGRKEEKGKKIRGPSSKPEGTSRLGGQRKRRVGTGD